MDEDQQEMILDPDNEDEEQEQGDFPDLHALGARYRNIGIKAIFDDYEPLYASEPAAPVILYLLYPDLRRDIVQELRPRLVVSGPRRFEIGPVAEMFRSLGELNVREEIDQGHAKALLEFVDELGSLMVEAWRQSPETRFWPTHDISYPLYAPVGPIVTAKLLQYAQSVQSITSLTLSCADQYRAFRPDEAEELVSSILNLKQLEKLDIQIDLTGVLLLELSARLKDLKHLSQFYICGVNEDVPQDFPHESQVIRNIRQISSLKSLHLSFVILGESTVNLFSATEGTYTKLDIDRCRFQIGGDDEDKDPSALLLAVGLASNTRLKELSLNSVQGSGAFLAGIGQGLLRNRTLRRLRVMNDSAAHQQIPEFAYSLWMQSIRLHPSLRQLALNMTTWSGRVADAVCSVVRENTSLRSMELYREDDVREFDPEWVGAVFQALQANRTMVYVQIWARSGIGARNWDRLSELLNVNNTIESFQLGAGVESVPERVIELLQRIKSNRTLQRLGLTNACFDQHHTGALVHLLAGNYVLVSLGYTSYDQHRRPLGREHYPISCSDEGSKILLKGILDLNYYGRKYLISEPNSVVHGVSLLSHVSSNLDAVYFHLRENPRLCDRREWKSLVAVRHLNAIPCGSDRCDRKRPRHAIERQADL